jgi:hypothetical protein
MKVSQCVHYWLEYHKLHSKKSTLKTYQSVLSKLTVQFGERDLDSLTPEEGVHDKFMGGFDKVFYLPYNLNA